MTSESMCLNPGRLAPAPSRAGSLAASWLRMPSDLRLSPRAAFLLKASITLTFLAGSSAPTPLYGIYQARWGFSSTMLTAVFAIYAIAVLGSLLVAGRLSDHVGRRPVLIAAAFAQAVAMVIFATADGLHALFLGRIIQGLSAGAAIAAVGAGLLDIDRARGAVANAVAPMIGTATGGVIAGFMVSYLPAPLHLVYAALGLVFVAQGIAVLFIHETASLRPGALTSLRPVVGVPAAIRGPLLMAVPALVAVWALGGFYASLGPKVTAYLAGSTSILLGGFALFVLAGSGALAVLVFQDRDPKTLMRIGATALIAGVGLALVGDATRSIVLFLVGTAIAGTGFGTGFQGALRTATANVEAHDRARVVSVVFTISYVAMGVPAILAGYRLALTRDIVETTCEFGAVVVVLAGLALAGTFRRAK